MLGLVAGRTGKQIEESLLPKIESYLDPGTYKVVRIGNIVQRLELENGNRIIFQSLENPSMARERLQSYVAHIFWADEMPPTLGIFTELQLRVQARGGYGLASFTPLVVNEEIRKYVDSASLPLAKKYRFSMMDNPVYQDPQKRADILQSMIDLPEAVRKTRIDGDWASPEHSVYYFDWDTMVGMPEKYSPLWRHVESVDPATQSALGLTIWAEDPDSLIWFCIHAEYIKGIYVPTQIVAAVQERTKNINIVRRIADPEASWYINQAAAMGVNYVGVYKKSGRKADLIKGLQQFLGIRGRISPHCGDLLSELQECHYSTTDTSRIVNASRYHLLDSAQYFCDNVPKAETQKIIASTHQEWLYRANEKRLVKEAAVIAKAEKAAQPRQARGVIRRAARPWGHISK